MVRSGNTSVIVDTGSVRKRRERKKRRERERERERET